VTGEVFRDMRIEWKIFLPLFIVMSFVLNLYTNGAILSGRKAPYWG